MVPFRSHEHSAIFIASHSEDESDHPKMQITLILAMMRGYSGLHPRRDHALSMETLFLPLQVDPKMQSELIGKHVLEGRPDASTITLFEFMHM